MMWEVYDIFSPPCDDGPQQGDVEEPQPENTLYCFNQILDSQENLTPDEST
ncbi:hypothetical protein [Calothrix sp. 336/3]|uniref:hypothetical protein n=1 Tax=Calothrix sp. 336/3 TaxID=1337936 RepID=UPI00143B848A|nr:hypothetical protein [Calothrix sp. 336/3]